MCSVALMSLGGSGEAPGIQSWGSWCWDWPPINCHREQVPFPCPAEGQLPSYCPACILLGPLLGRCYCPSLP